MILLHRMTQRSAAGMNGASQEGKRARGEDVKMRKCEDEKMWGWEDAKMRRCEDEKMWRWEDVKTRICEDEKMWRWEDVKIRRWKEFFTDPHYWKNPALRRSRKKIPRLPHESMQRKLWNIQNAPFYRTHHPKTADEKATSNECTSESRSQNEIGIFTTHSGKKHYFFK